MSEHLRILHARDLPFQVDANVAETIEELIDALESEDPWAPMIAEDLIGTARAQSEEEYQWIRWYYCFGHWIDEGLHYPYWLAGEDDEYYGT